MYTMFISVYSQELLNIFFFVGSGRQPPALKQIKLFFLHFEKLFSIPIGISAALLSELNSKDKAPSSALGLTVIYLLKGTSNACISVKSPNYNKNTFMK
jgi:hypothetical protein